MVVVFMGAAPCRRIRSRVSFSMASMRVLQRMPVTSHGRAFSRSTEISSRTTRIFRTPFLNIIQRFAILADQHAFTARIGG